MRPAKPWEATVPVTLTANSYAEICVSPKFAYEVATSIVYRDDFHDMLDWLRDRDCFHRVEGFAVERPTDQHSQFMAALMFRPVSVKFEKAEEATLFKMFWGAEG